jgi:hypothetical protein
MITFFKEPNQRILVSPSFTGPCYNVPDANIHPELYERAPFDIADHNKMEQLAFDTYDVIAIEYNHAYDKDRPTKFMDMKDSYTVLLSEEQIDYGWGLLKKDTRLSWENRQSQICDSPIKALSTVATTTTSIAPEGFTAQGITKLKPQSRSVKRVYKSHKRNLQKPTLPSTTMTTVCTTVAPIRVTRSTSTTLTVNKFELTTGDQIPTMKLIIEGNNRLIKRLLATNRKLATQLTTALAVNAEQVETCTLAFQNLNNLSLVVNRIAVGMLGKDHDFVIGEESDLEGNDSDQSDFESQRDEEEREDGFRSDEQRESDDDYEDDDDEMVDDDDLSIDSENGTRYAKEE